MGQNLVMEGVCRGDDSNVDGVGSRCRLLAGAHSTSLPSSSRARFRDRSGSGYLQSKGIMRKVDEGVLIRKNEGKGKIFRLGRFTAR